MMVVLLELYTFIPLSVTLIVLWAVGRCFGPVLEGIRRSHPPRVSQLWVRWLVSTRHHWADIFIVRRHGPDGRKGSTMNSTATCSTRRGMGSVRLYVACDSPCDENEQPYHIGSVAVRVYKDRAFRRTPGRRCQACYLCIIEDSRKRQHHHWHMEHKDTKSCRETPGTNTRNGQVHVDHSWTL